MSTLWLCTSINPSGEQNTSFVKLASEAQYIKPLELEKIVLRALGIRVNEVGAKAMPKPDQETVPHYLLDGRIGASKNYAKYSKTFADAWSSPEWFKSQFIFVGQINNGRLLFGLCLFCRSKNKRNKNYNYKYFV